MREKRCSLVLPCFVLVVVSLASAQRIEFRDVTADAGIRFAHNNGAFGKKWLPETMGPGCAFIDYDNDGFGDILVTALEQSHLSTTTATGRSPTSRKLLECGGRASFPPAPRG